MPIDMDRFWEDDADKRPGVADAHLADWEKKYGVTLPAILRDALKRQNGGVIRYNDVRVLPLEAIEIPDADFFEWVAPGTAAPNGKWLFQFAYGDEDPMYLMNFNAAGPNGEPSVHHVFHDPGDMEDEAPTLDAFFAKLLDVTLTPAVDWSETTRLDVMLFQETVPYDQTIHMEQVLGRLNGVLLLYTRDEASREITKTTIPEPISTSIDGIWPMLSSIHMAQIEPNDPNGIVAVESRRTHDGAWKNRTEQGVPVYVTIESISKDKLQALREALIGKAAVRAEDRRRWWFTWIVVPIVVMTAFPVVVAVLAVLWSLRLLYWLFGLSPPRPGSPAST